MVLVVTITAYTEIESLFIIINSWQQAHLPVTTFQSEKTHLRSNAPGA
jgi:hypothetical protein